jgi:tetratricopeptide (TPR) repeat protein
MAPGLPTETQEKILERAEGVPLYAVETVRMLLDRGLLVQEGNSYRPVGPIETLDVPESLHALIAARLDGLTHDERRLLQDASVLGKTFTREGIAALTGRAQSEVEQSLSTLVRKEVLGIQADPRSPERGQFGFLQDLVKRVAYETLSKRDRVQRHLGVARLLEERLDAGEEDLIEVIASHYGDAFREMPDAPDAAEIKEKAQETLTRAAERAASLAANEAAERYFVQAADLAGHEAERARLLERAGAMAHIAGRNQEARSHFGAAATIFDEMGLTHDAARVATRVADVDFTEGRVDDAISRLESALPLVSREEPDEALATVLAQLARMHYFKGDVRRSAERIEQALEIAEPMWFPSVVAQGLITKALVVEAMSRREESEALLKHALELALEYDDYRAAYRAYNNLAAILMLKNQVDEARAYSEQGRALALKLGAGFDAKYIGVKPVYSATQTGEWDEALAFVDEMFEEPDWEDAASLVFEVVAFIQLHRGDVSGARATVENISWAEHVENVEWRADYTQRRSQVLLAEGNSHEALELAQAAWEARKTLGTGWGWTGFDEVAEAALQSARLDVAEELLKAIESLRPAERTPLLQAQAARFSARLSKERAEHNSVEPRFKEAAGLFRELGFRFWLAVTLLEHGEWLFEQQRGDEATSLLDEAREIFERLEARPWLERLERALPQHEAARA